MGASEDGGTPRTHDRAAAATLAATRDALRARGRAARAALHADERAAATAAVVRRLAALDELRTARRVLLTRAVGDELDLGALETLLLDRGVTVALPVVDGVALRVVDLDRDRTTRPGWRGVAEPVGRPTDAPVDVVVVPALALDRRGERLGYGGGHFDRLLGGAAAEAVAVGAVFACQLVEEVPVAPHDVRLDVVVTEDGCWRDGVRGRC